MKINFGKYKGVTVEHIYNTDPTYFEWLLKNGNTKQKGIKEYCMLFTNHIEILKNDTDFFNMLKAEYDTKIEKIKTINIF